MIVNKKYFKICSLIATLVLVFSCSTKKTVIPDFIPCSAIDDSLYIRELGRGKSFDLQSARIYALHDGQHKIIHRFCDSIQNYFHYVEYSNDSIIVGRTDTIVLYRYSIKFFGELSYTLKECEKVQYDVNNQWNCYMTLSVSKNDFSNCMNRIINLFDNNTYDLESFSNKKDSTNNY